MRAWSFTLVVLGSVLCVGVLAPVVYLESGGLPPFDATYFWMMIAPVIVVALVLIYQWELRIDRASSIAVVVTGVGVALYPWWGPPFWPAMAMPFDWIGTVLSMYLPGVLIAAGGLLQLRLPPDAQRGRRYRSVGAASTS